MRTIITLAAASAALIAFPAAASAAPGHSTEFDTVVQHDDLDLVDHADAARLDERVRTKVRQLCRIGGRDAETIRLERECRDSALAMALPQVRLAVAEANADRARFASIGQPSSTADRAATPGA